MLEIINLSVEVNQQKIIKEVTLTFQKGKIHALMGPNGSGKSTLAKAIMGHPNYKITKGKIILNNHDITNLKPEERAKLGLFLSFQNPQAISGVTVSKFLRAALNSISGKNFSVLEFHTILREKMSLLKIDPAFASRYVNSGFSGGEKKKLEMLQLLILRPKYVLLDETDSGLDIDAIKTVAESLNKIKQEQEMSIIVITHYNRFLELLKPEEINVLCKGRVIAQGDYQLAQKIEKEGFKKIKG